MEKPSVAMKRDMFLRQYVELRKRYKFVWLDETWIFQKGGQKTRSWQDLDVRSCPVKSASSGKRYNVLYAGTEDGWVEGCSLVFASGSSRGDYHGEMNGLNFMNWWANLLNQLREPMVIVMDNAPYHSIQAKFLIRTNVRCDAGVVRFCKSYGNRVKWIHGQLTLPIRWPLIRLEIGDGVFFLICALSTGGQPMKLHPNPGKSSVRGKAVYVLGLVLPRQMARIILFHFQG